MSPEQQPIPEGTRPPVGGVFVPSDVTVLYTGPGSLDGLDGHVELALKFLPRPRITFEFAPGDPLSFKEILFAPFNSSAQLAVEIGSTTRILEVLPDRRGETISGVVNAASVSANASKLKLLVVNGPKVRGRGILYGKTANAGRILAEVDGCCVTLDSLPGGRPEVDRSTAYRFTHVIEVSQRSQRGFPEEVKSSLFWTLSLMNCRWVGLVGPWFYEAGDHPVDTAYRVTKVSHQGFSASWFNEDMLGVFTDLLPLVHAALADQEKRHAMVTAMHWLIESSLCSGGIEGSLILQQAALECLAWHEIVQTRKLYSKTKFKGPSAAEKIRELLSLWKIETAIPSKFIELAKYAAAQEDESEEDRADIPAVLTGIRNVLVHAEPTKSVALFTRPEFESEIEQAWSVVRGALQQAVLASLGYTGLIVRHDRDVQYVTEAIEPAPWSNAESKSRNDAGGNGSS